MWCRARPAGARMKTRLRLSAADQMVVRAVGEYLGSLAAADLAWRCRLGRGGDQRAVRKRILTGRSSSRWAGSLTRTSNGQWRRGMANLTDRRIALRRARRAIGSRLLVPVGRRQGSLRSQQTAYRHTMSNSPSVQERPPLVDGELQHGAVRVPRVANRDLGVRDRNLDAPG